MYMLSIEPQLNLSWELCNYVRPTVLYMRSKISIAIPSKFAIFNY